jgi:hypothetical protein
MIDIPPKRTGIVAAGALFAVCALALAPRLAQARGIVPKGTPYAAVVSATVTGETYVEVHTQDVTDNVCEDQSAVSTYNGSVDIHWSASYPSITVPVADAKDLGKAYGRLHLNLKPFVGPGKAGQFTGNFDISGSEPATTYGNQYAGGSDCKPVPFSASGGFTPCLKPPSLIRSLAPLPRGVQMVYVLQMESVCLADPAQYEMPDGDTRDPVQDLQAAAGKVSDVPGNPPAGAFGIANGRPVPGWDGLSFTFGNDKFKPLVHRSSLKLRFQDNDLGGGEDCGSSPDDGTGSDSCKVSWRYYYVVTFKRKVLHRTTRAYPR